MTVRGIITVPPFLAEGVTDYKRPGELLRVELCRGGDGIAALRRTGDDEVFTVEELPPSAHLRLTEPPTDDDGRQLVTDIVNEGLPLASPWSGTAFDRGRQLNARRFRPWSAAARGLVRREYRAAMPEFVEALSLTALVAATLEYAIVMRHREERRDAVRWQAEVRESLLSVRGIGAAPQRRWTDDGSRFRVVP